MAELTPGNKSKIDKIFKVYVGIDFGTDGTGLAYALPDGNVYIHQKWKGYKRSVEVKPKTRILLDADGKFMAFGQPATDSYITVGSKNGWMLFERFKMALYDSKSSDHQDLKAKLVALNGKEWDSDKVFIEALKYIKDQVFKFFKKNKLNIDKIEDVQWILTVPAIWSERAKYKMEQWVFKAGLTTKEIPNHLKIVYEPDCASLSIQNEIASLKKANSFIVGDNNEAISQENNNNNNNNENNETESKIDDSNEDEQVIDVEIDNETKYETLSENNEFGYVKCQMNDDIVYMTKDQIKFINTNNVEYTINEVNNDTQTTKVTVKSDDNDQESNVYLTENQMNLIKNNVVETYPAATESKEINADNDSNNNNIPIIKDKAVVNINETSSKDALKNASYKEGNMQKHWRKGERYILVDAGGGTVDVACHEIVDDGIGVKEIVHPTGGPYGSTYIDDEFEKLIRNIFGQDIINEFTQEDPSGYAELVDNFRHSKQQFYNNEDIKSNNDINDDSKTHNINLPFDFMTFLEEKIGNNDDDNDIESVIDNAVLLEQRGLVELAEESLKMNYIVWKELLFNVVTTPIIKHVKDLLETTIMKNSTSYICLVGGLGSSKYLQYLFHKHFGIKSEYKLHIITPSRPILSVVDGAARFGLKPDYIQARTLAKTYGNAIDPRIDVIDVTSLPDGYLEENKYRCDHTKAIRIRNVFSVYVKKHQTININDKPIIRKYKRFNKKQKKVRISVFSSDDDDPKVVTGRALAKTTIIFPDKSNELSITVELYFSDTKIRVFAYPDDCPDDKREMELDYEYVK